MIQSASTYLQGNWHISSKIIHLYPSCQSPWSGEVSLHDQEVPQTSWNSHASAVKTSASQSFVRRSRRVSECTFLEKSRLWNRFSSRCRSTNNPKTILPLYLQKTMFQNQRRILNVKTQPKKEEKKQITRVVLTPAKVPKQVHSLMWTAVKIQVPYKSAQESVEPII